MVYVCDLRVCVCVTQLSEKAYVDLLVCCLCSGERSWVRFQTQSEDSRIKDPGSSFQGIGLGKMSIFGSSF